MLAEFERATGGDGTISGGDRAQVRRVRGRLRQTLREGLSLSLLWSVVRNIQDVFGLVGAVLTVAVILGTKAL